LAGADDFLRIERVELNIEDIDIGESLEQHTLTFHHGLAGQRANVAQAQYRGSIGNHRDQVSLCGVLVCKTRVPLNREARNSDAWRVCQTQVALRETGFGGSDRDL